MQICPADRAGMHADQHLMGSWSWRRNIFGNQRQASLSIEYHRPHCARLRKMIFANSKTIDQISPKGKV
jgi:hypothetical protein